MIYWWRIYSIKHLQIGNMISKEDALLLLQSQPLAASLHVLGGEPKSNAYAYLQDPAWVESAHWNQLGEVLDQKVSTLEEPMVEEKVVEEESPVTGIERMEQHADVVYLLSPEVPEVTEQSKDQKMKKEVNKPEKRQRKKSKEQVANKAVGQIMDSNLDFYHWLSSLTDHSIEKEATSKKPPKPKANTRKSASSSLAENSLVLGEEIVSETLAKLLARQGHKEEAIAMYEKLILKFPQKERTFAAAIEKLKL